MTTNTHVAIVMAFDLLFGVIGAARAVMEDVEGIHMSNPNVQRPPTHPGLRGKGKGKVRKSSSYGTRMSFANPLVTCWFGLAPDEDGGLRNRGEFGGRGREGPYAYVDE
jgi:hypothetical protein